ncbi:isopenicillin N synthase family oxygenase [Streptomyces microflavus]|uniref:Isopenicillin N synthase family oxygenase n=1 Tax=Streptomyces microflavus TaxID=1919 RepID=A0A7H8MYA9_STRMI|nr:isopenicillin N synthase family oxygenase [Streptomyces microflavus]QKW47144.1 isopenicillin N synthase family oxygenase [Streptomyces microflavus]
MIPHVQLPGQAADWTSKDLAEVAADIGGHCRREGFLFVHNHGVPADLITSAFEETKRFYQLSPAEKSRYDASEGSQFLGYRGLGRERSRTHGGTEACEQYRVGNTTDELPLPTSVNLFHAPFPKSLELFRHLTRLGDGILAACALDLGMEEDAFAPYLADSPLHRLGLNYYGASRPPCDGAAAVDAMSPHIDLTLLTILDQDEPGLEVQDANGTWLEVPTVPGALFLFLGDYVQRWSNGTHRAALHRVTTVHRDRMSIQYKHRPDYGVVVQPLDALTGPANPPAYTPFNTGPDYVARLRSLLAG